MKSLFVVLLIATGCQTSQPVVLLRSYSKTNVVEAYRETLTPNPPNLAIYMFKDHPVATNRVTRYEFGIRDGTNEVQVWAIEK